MKNKNQKLKCERGITLIVLIITIVVMLILVAVTVMLSLGDNGILSNTKESAELSERAQLHEQMLGAMMLTKDGKIKRDETYDLVKSSLSTQGYSVGELQEDGTFEVNGIKGTYKYKITETEIIIVEENSDRNDTSEEEIVWAYIDWFGEYYGLLYLGNSEEIEITEDKEINAYVGFWDEEEEEYRYNIEEVTTVRYSEVEEINIEKNVKKITIGKVLKNADIYPSYEMPWELVILGDYGDIPEYGFDDKDIEKVVIEEGVTTIGSCAFSKNNLTSVTIPASVTSIGQSAFGSWEYRTNNHVIYYGGTKEQWEKIEMDINRTFGNISDNAKIVFADGTEELVFSEGK